MDAIISSSIKFTFPYVPNTYSASMPHIIHIPKSFEHRMAGKSIPCDKVCIGKVVHPAKNGYDYSFTCFKPELLRNYGLDFVAATLTREQVIDFLQLNKII